MQRVVLPSAIAMVLQAYTVVAPQVAAYPAYRQPMAVALLRVKLRHWDSTLRSLAAEAGADS